MSQTVTCSSLRSYYCMVLSLPVPNKAIDKVSIKITLCLYAFMTALRLNHYGTLYSYTLVRKVHCIFTILKEHIWSVIKG
jgi:hypothetical protein